ncbi:gluconokinase [Sphingomonas nostoxanthinifaciens]|nr:gluconokinase [Sphingomonas nostoxanthinifaciens]
MGVSGSGKSTLGAMLAGTLDAPFLEGDAFHPAANVAKMHSGEPLTDEDRWPWLDRLGRALGEAVIERGTAVAACSALKRSYRVRLREAAGMPITFVLLEADRQELMRRMSERPGHFMPTSLLDSQLDTLELPGSDEPAIILDAREPADRLCARIREKLEASL